MHRSDAAEIHDLEERRYQAMRTRDMAALTELLDDELTYTHSGATVDTKQSYLAGLAAKIWDYQKIERRDERVIVRGETALVFSRLIIDINIRGAAKHLDNKALAVWTRRGGSWRLLALHSVANPVA